MTDRKPWEARLAALKAQSGADAANAMNPPKGYRDELQRKGIAPKDHHRDNVKKIKALEQEAAEKRRQEEERRNSEPFMMEQFKGVESRLSAEPKAAPESKHYFLKKKEEPACPAPSNSQHKKKKEKGKPPVPAKDDVAALPHKERKNVISKNIREVCSAKPKREEKQEALYMEKKDFGKVPDYIINRKIELAMQAEQKKKEEEQKAIPPGMVLMSEEERQKTLELLYQNREKIENDMQHLPLTIETPSMINKQNQLFAKLKEVEDAIKVFSRKQVFISV